MLLPALVLLTLLVVVPLGLGTWTGFLNLNISTLHDWLLAPFVGLGNYREGFSGKALIGASLGRSILASIEFSVLTTIVIAPIGILAALTVHGKFKGRTLVRSLYIVPYVIPTFVTALIGRLAFLNGTGAVDRLLSALHLASSKTFWLIGSKSFWAMLLVEIWATWAFVYLMTLAGLQSIPHDLYESAEVDGAGSFRKFFSVVLPQLKRVLGIAFLLSTIGHFNNFTLPYVMFGQSPPNSADVLPVNAYVTSFGVFEFGLGSAMAVVTMLVMIIPGVFYLRSLRLTEVTP